MSIFRCRSSLFQDFKAHFSLSSATNTKRSSILLKDKSSSEIKPYDEEEFIHPETPVKFSTSRAAVWKTQYKAIIKDPDSLKNPDEIYRMTVRMLTVMLLIVYAFVRGENDLDAEIAMPLGKRMLTLREYELNKKLKSAIANDEGIDDIQLELHKLAKLRKEYKYDEE